MPLEPDLPDGAKLLVRGGRVYDHEGDIHRPAVADVRIEGTRIAAVAPDLAPTPGETVIDAAGKLVIPGLVNAHYHSHDVLAKGLIEELPLEIWYFYSRMPDATTRSPEEVRTRTLLGAWECLRNGITTLQDMNNRMPLEEDYLDVVLQAYADIGIRIVFSSAIQDISNAHTTPYWCETMPPAMFAEVAGAAPNWKDQVGFVEAQIKRSSRVRDSTGRSDPPVHSAVRAPCSKPWATSPSAMTFQCTPTSWRQGRKRLEGRLKYGRFDSSLVRYLADIGLLGPRLNLVHAVWMRRDEVDLVADKGGRIVHNPASNLKLKSGIAPILEMRRAGIELALGCDNTSAGDSQNIFQAMRLYALLAAVSDPELGRPSESEAVHAATLGGAATAMLSDQIGAVRPGMKADLAILDLNDPAFLPFNSAARQLVYSECGRSVESVIVDGRVVMRDGRLITIDEDELRERVVECANRYRQDFGDLVVRNQRFRPQLDAAHRRTWETDVGISRYAGAYDGGATGRTGQKLRRPASPGSP